MEALSSQRGWTANHPCLVSSRHAGSGRPATRASRATESRHSREARLNETPKLRRAARLSMKGSSWPLEVSMKSRTRASPRVRAMNSIISEP
jgi:hypothetical protein